MNSYKKKVKSTRKQNEDSSLEKPQNTFNRIREIYIPVILVLNHKSPRSGSNNYIHADGWVFISNCLKKVTICKQAKVEFHLVCLNTTLNVPIQLLFY